MLECVLQRVRAPCLLLSVLLVRSLTFCLCFVLVFASARVFCISVSFLSSWCQLLSGKHQEHSTTHNGVSFLVADSACLLLFNCHLYSSFVSVRMVLLFVSLLCLFSLVRWKGWNRKVLVERKRVRKSENGRRLKGTEMLRGLLIARHGN